MAPAPPLPPGTDVWKTPAAPAPDGFTHNLENPATNENIGVITLSIFIAIATIFVGMRLYVRFRVINHTPWWDDLVLVLALPPQIAYTGIIIYMLKAGMAGRHLWDTPLGIPLFKLPYWTTIVAALAQPITLLVKNALLLLYLRIFKPNRMVRYGIYFGMVVVTVMYIVWMFVFIFQASFANTVGQHLGWAQASFNVATDVYIFLLPISGVARLHVSPKRKLGIICIFSTGIAAIVMSCLTLFWRVQYNGVSPDPTWTATTRMSIGALEIDVGIMCACMPLFAPFLPKKDRLANWTTYFRSMRSRLLRSNPTQGSKGNSSNPQYGNVSDSELVQKNATYIELGERKSGTSSVRQEQAGRREWFDGTTTMDDTVADRASKDVSQMNYQQQY